MQTRGRRRERVGRKGDEEAYYSVGIFRTRDLCHLDFWSSFNSSEVLLKFLPGIPFIPGPNYD